MIQDPILITGCARSFTSLVAGIVNICGAWGGVLQGPTQWNQKGFFENLEIRNTIVKPFYRSIGADPLGQWPLPNLKRLPDQPDWRDRILSILVQQGLQEEYIWFYKCAKACQIWPIWAKAFPNAKWIVVRRRKEEIVQSCMKTPFMKAFSDPKGWGNWIDIQVDLFRDMFSAGLNLCEIWPHKMILGDFSEIESIIEWCGLSWNEEKIIDFIDPSLYHYKHVEGVKV